MSRDRRFWMNVRSILSLLFLSLRDKVISTTMTTAIVMISALAKREMKLKQMLITETSQFVGKTLKESGIRDKYNCMVVGLERGEENLLQPSPEIVFAKGDIVWIVGEEESLRQAMQ